MIGKKLAVLPVITIMCFLVSCNNTMKKSHAILAMHIARMEKLNASMTVDYGQCNQKYLKPMHSVDDLKNTFTKLEELASKETDDKIIMAIYCEALDKMSTQDSMIVATLKNSKHNYEVVGRAATNDDIEVNKALDFEIKYFSKSSGIARLAWQELFSLEKKATTKKSAF